MKSTIKQAERNERNLHITFRGHGHWRVFMDYRGKRISATTNNSEAVDNFNSDIEEKKDGKNRRKLGYDHLCNEIIRKNDSTTWKN